jgi:hypothetical protein
LFYPAWSILHGNVTRIYPKANRQVSWHLIIRKKPYGTIFHYSVWRAYVSNNSSIRAFLSVEPFLLNPWPRRQACALLNLCTIRTQIQLLPIM